MTDNPAPFESRCYQLSINAWLTAGILLLGAIGWLLWT